MMNRYLAICILIVISQLVKVTAADSAYFTLADTPPLIGQPFEIILHIVAPQNAQINLPDIAAEWVGVTVTQIGELTIGSQQDDGSAEYVVPMTIVLWKTGQVVLPPVMITYQLAGSNPFTVSTEGTAIAVSETLTANDLMLRPAKPQISVPYIPAWIIIVLGVVICTILFLWFTRRRLLNQRTSSHVNRANFGDTPASKAEVTLKQLSTLETHPSAFYQRSASTLRTYISARWLPQSLDLTTGELVSQLKKERLLNDPNLQSLSEMLRFADLVKFSQVSPDIKAGQQFVLSALTWIHSVDENPV